jgi:osmotically-inducible protein OsmY
MAQQHRGPHGQENQQRSGWRERFFGDRNEDERNRESESDWEEQGGRRGLSGYSRGESEQSGWERGADEDRWGQSGESRRYQQGQQSGRSDPYGGGQQQRYGSSGQYEQGGYGRSRYGEREQGGYGGGGSYQREGYRGEQQRGYGESREAGRSGSSEWRPEESSRQRQSYGRQYESQSFDQPYPPGFQSEFGSSQGSRYGSGRQGYAEYGAHRGKGPKGYTRSDDRLKEIICEKLTDDPMIDASEINVEVTSQIVKLTGTVDDRSTKYDVEELIERCGGVKDIDNQLRVRSGSSQRSQLGSQGGSMESAGGSYGSGTGQTSASGASQTTSQSAREGLSGSSGTKRNN